MIPIWNDEVATPVIKPTDAISMLAFWSEPTYDPSSSPRANTTRSGDDGGSSSDVDSSTRSNKTSDTLSNGSNFSKSVRFSTIEVREYPITIGDCLSVAQGIPHTIEWDHLEDETKMMNVNQYERKRPPQRRRQGESLILDSPTRERMLRSVGYTSVDFQDVRRAREVALRTLYC